MTKIAIGLVVKEGKEFIKQWLECAEKIADEIYVIDNGADFDVFDELTNCPKVKYYLMQKGLERNMSRDYQKILDIAREENCDWVLNLDIDEYIRYIPIHMFKDYLNDSTDFSIAFPMIEMRNDNQHFVKINDSSGDLKLARMVHKCYKVVSHFKFDIRDKHGCSIPHNCPRTKQAINIIIEHYGHMTKGLRDKKREKIGYEKDGDELKGSWMEDDDSKVIIEHIDTAYMEVMKNESK
jgi:hypothetical protein